MQLYVSLSIYYGYSFPFQLCKCKFDILFLNLLRLFLFMCVHAHMCHGACGEIKGHLTIDSSLLLHLGPGDQTQVVWLGVMSVYVSHWAEMHMHLCLCVCE